jgi:hypothetical protein
MSQQHIDNGLDQQTRNNSLATQHPEETKSIVAAAAEGPSMRRRFLSLESLIAKLEFSIQSARSS